MLCPIFISSDLVTRRTQIEKCLAALKVKSPSADLWTIDANTKLPVEKISQISKFLSVKPIKNPLRIVVLEALELLSSDAQNALLKTIEEPPKHSLVILGIDSTAHTLETILSRCEIHQLQFQVIPPSTELLKQIAQLAEQSIEQRFAVVEKIDKKLEFLNALEFYYHQKLAQDLRIKDFLQEVIHAQKLMERNVNPRAILESLMLKMPNLK